MFNQTGTLIHSSILAFTSRLLNQLSFLVLFLAISRWQGPEEAGTFTLALRFSILFTTLALWGIEGYLIREVSANPSQAPDFLINSGISRSIFGVIAIIFLFWLIASINQYQPKMVTVIFLLSLSIIPEIITRMFFAVFFANLQFHYPLIVSLILSIIRSGGGLYLLQINGLYSLAIFLTVTSLFGALLSALVFLSRPHRSTGTTASFHARIGELVSGFNRRFLRIELVNSTPFAFLEILYIVDVQADIFIISLLMQADQIGYYAAAQSVVAVLAFAHYGYSAGLYPILTRLVRSGQESLWTFYENLFRFSATIILPLMLGLLVFAQPITHFIFSMSFDPSVAVLQWLIWSFAIQFIEEPNSRMTIVSGRQSVLTVFLAISVVITIVLNLILIPAFGISGAAIARLISKLVYATLNGAFVYKNICRINLLPLLGRISVSFAIMATGMMLIPSSNAWVRIIPTGILYAGLIFLLGAVNIREVYGYITRKGYCLTRSQR